jgi:hypothetical protein
MDFIGVGGFALSALGVGLAIWAKIEIVGVKKAVANVIEKNSDQSVRDNARDLLQKLTNARDAAMGRRRGASRLSSAGRSREQDVNALQLAQSALATTLVGSGGPLGARLRVAASSLAGVLQALQPDQERDGWAEAQDTLQSVIPDVETISVSLAAKALS